ncbi:MAG TPA: AAA family ATPase [Jatrophihabitantaceae bacterium]|nr:AAA family ATPase [Jatrophihabitantaceae bacterium]
MARRVQSRQLVGRTDELAALLDAATAAAGGQARTVLISGDAGIGKSRLITEAAAHARSEGFIVALGGCLQLGEVSVAYAPLVEALRDLRVQLGEDELDALAGPGLAEIGALFGEGDGSTRPPSGSSSLFEHLLAFLTRLGQRQPVMLVFEDMHWADASTRDLVAFLGRNLRSAAVALLLSYRADELHRRHPLRPLVADLERDPHVERITLEGLDRAELVSLLGEISDDALPDAAVDELLARSEGNPFYVEELIAAGGMGRGLPATLADVILGRVAMLSERTQAVLHDAAVLGHEVDDALLADVTGQPLDVVITALREAVYDQLLAIDGDACRFRHALVREALYDDMLPGERERMHVAAAQALQTSSRLSEQARWASIAYHWDAAHDTAQAFEASVRAGIEAEKVYALADAAEQFERALRLHDRVPDADSLAGMTRADLLVRAADAVQASSRTSRAIVLAEAALRELGDDARPEARALVLVRIGLSNWTQHHGAASVAAYEQAVAILDGRPPSRERARALAALGQSLMLRNLYRDAEATLRQAIDIATQVGARDVEGHALCSLGPSLAGLGHVDEGLVMVRRARELSAEFGSDDVSRTYVNEAHSLYIGGRRYDEAAKVAAEGVEYAIQHGQQSHYGEAIAGNAIAALICAGRWRDAERVRADPRVPGGDPYLELRFLALLLGQGRYDEARRLVRASLDSTADADDVQFRAQALLLAGELVAIDQRWDDARDLVSQALDMASRTDDQFYSAQILGAAMGIEADRAESARGAAERAVADRLAERVRAFPAAVTALGADLLPESRAWLVTADAQHERLLGRDTAAGWAAVADIWDDVGQPHPVAMARYRQADALLRARGDRDDAARVARDALRIAERLGAEPLAARIRQLAQRGRLELSGAPAARDPAAALNITPREIDVLRLLADGRTNRQIGEALFISEKTASVHVTNLLRKLGVPNRVEAAAIAQRVGLSGSG